MSTLTSAIPVGSIVLVTGVTGHIASHIADQFLQKGYRVRGSVRSKEKAAWIEELFKPYGEGKFETAVVPDMIAEGAFDEAVKEQIYLNLALCFIVWHSFNKSSSPNKPEDTSAVIHVASNVSFSPDPNAVIPPTIAGVLSALRAAAKTPSVKRFVYTSSSTAAANPVPDKVFHMGSSTWNTSAIEDAWAPPPYEGSERSWAAYSASKTQAEQEVWKFVKEQNPHFTANCVLPNSNLGAILDPVHQPSLTSKWPIALLNGEPIKNVPPQWMINVRDTARLHVIAAIDPDVKNARLFAFAEPFNWVQLAEMVKKVAGPSKSGKMLSMEALAKEVVGGKDVSTVENGPAEELLRKWYGKGFTGMEETVKENLEAA
ncbi:MAG: hypothetical protein Q9227_005556 [Pyrenula ochraceoflavens]